MIETKNASPHSVEHGALRAAGTALRGQLAATRCDCGSETGCDCLRERVEDLHRRLLPYFDAEEARWHSIEPGSVDWITLRWIAQLERDHDRFRLRAAELRVGLADPRPSPALRSKVGAIVDDLLEHELSDTRLFQRLVFEDQHDSVSR